MDESTEEMSKYKCHKEVHADKIERIAGKYGREHGATLTLARGKVVEVSREYLDKHEPKTGGYYVVYEDGYSSYSPAEAFEKGYTRVE